MTSEPSSCSTFHAKFEAFVDVIDISCLIWQQTKGAKYVGHSANVTGVSFSHDDSHVISIGGDDYS
jgi:hypothetical protein